MSGPSLPGLVVAFHTPFHAVRIGVDTPKLLARFAAMMAGYPPLNEPLAEKSTTLVPLTYRIMREGARGRVQRQTPADAQWADVGESTDADDWMAFVEGDLYRQTVAAAELRGVVPIHGAVIGHEAGAMIVAGESGAGKSTLTLALLSALATTRYYTDDFALWWPSDTANTAPDRIAGMPRLIGFSSPPAVPDAQWPPGFSVVPVRFIARNGERVEWPCVAVPRSRVADVPAPISAVVLPCHVPSAASANLSRVGTGVAVRRLWSLLHRRNPVIFAQLGRLADRVPVYELTAPTVPTAVAALAPLFLSPSTPPPS